MKAIGIVSGGLDSLVAVRLVQRMGLEPLLVHFVTGFEPTHVRAQLADPLAAFQPPESAGQLGAEIRVVDLRTPFLELLAAPRHGYGANMNPCIDCKILMLSQANHLRVEQNAPFVFSGEVIGQRPMSQRKDIMQLIARESEVCDRLVRPLCGTLLPETAPEREGVFSRAQLESIQGRSRQRQMELARELAIAHYPSPAGGCLLTDPGYSARVRELMSRREGRRLNLTDPPLLLVGRHIVLPGGAKAVIGRNAQENPVLERHGSLGVLLEADGIPGPLTWVEGEPSASDLQAAARLTARYGKGRGQAKVLIVVKAADGQICQLDLPPGTPDGCRIL